MCLLILLVVKNMESVYMFMKIDFQGQLQGNNLLISNQKVEHAGKSGFK